MLGTFCRLALCAVGLTWLLAGHAQSQTATPLTLDEAIRRVTDHNPSLAAFAPRLNALRCIHANINAGLVSTGFVRMHDRIRMGLGKAVHIAVGTRVCVHPHELGCHEQHDE